MIALRSNRKFLVYDWNTLRDYFYLPVQFEVITEKGKLECSELRRIILNTLNTSSLSLSLS